MPKIPGGIPIATFRCNKAGMIFSKRIRSFRSVPFVVLSILFAMTPAFAHGHGHGAFSATLRRHPSRRSAKSAVAPYLTGAYPHPHSQYVALIDVGSGNLLYSINPNTPRPPASLTKIMASTVLLENGRLTDVVTAPAQVAGIPESSLHLRPGERITLQDLLYAMLLRSANDTPVAGAYYLCGSIPKFVDLMNEKAQEIGCAHTHFVTPNGLYDPNHYSSAYDLAMMSRYAAINYPMFNQIVKTQRWTVHRSIDQKDTLVVNTASSFLRDFPGADGIKTGYISQAGHCFVGSATRNGFRLIAVALDSPNCREDVEQMLSYGFAHFTSVAAVRSGTPEGSIGIPGMARAVPVTTVGQLGEVVPLVHASMAARHWTTDVRAFPTTCSLTGVRGGQAVGRLILYDNGRPVGSTYLVATQDVAGVPVAARRFAPRLLPGYLGRMPGNIGLLLTGSAFVAFLMMKLYAGASAKNSRRRRARLST
jgi:D-alanyl-D-alanine carboxypeptidase (penicillin-binding protein 5/6)